MQAIGSLRDKVYSIEIIQRGNGMSNLVNKTLSNRYHVLEFIGRGGMAEVYKVWDRERSSFLAMKLLHEDLAIDQVFIRRFK
jgi:serine/threonine protein kinase